MQATDPGINAVPIRCFEQAKDAAARKIWAQSGYLHGACWPEPVLEGQAWHCERACMNSTMVQYYVLSLSLQLICN